MVSGVDTHLHFIHQPHEVEELTKAVIPMAEYISAVCQPDERHKLKLIIGCKYFRAKEARKVRDMLLRACKYARANLGDYFPTMQSQILVNSKILEDATNKYWARFERLRDEAVPTY